MENSPKMTSPVDLSQMNREIYFLVAKFLSNGPMVKTAETLLREMEDHEMIPERVDWLGQSVKQDYNQYSAAQSHVTPDHLPKLLQQYLLTVHKKENVKVGHARSLLSTQLLRSHLTDLSERPPRLPELLLTRRRVCQSPIRKWGGGNPVNSVHALMAREVNGSGVGTERITPNFYTERVKLSCRSVGHLSAVYCVLYDMTGKYIFTGADDKLVKVWSAVNGRLLATLRGATGEITDMAINPENTLLAVGSNDKLIRVWSLPNCACLAVLKEHDGQITSVFFCPMSNSRSSVRYLASTATDGTCAFWAYTESPGKTAVFQPKPTFYQERMRPGHAQILCSSFSPGGVFMAAGSADNNVRVYYMLNADGPQRILEVECHKERVDTISWAHRGLRFVSGSKDGTALIYRFECQQWRYTRIHCSKQLPGEPPIVIDDPRKRPRVTMVAWNRNDTLVLTATSDFLVKTWNPLNGSLVRVLKGHTDEIYVVESHPFDPKIMVTAGHDGLIAMWDIGSAEKKESDNHYATKIFGHQNDIQGLGHGAIFDCKVAPNGLGLVATDSHGHLLIFSTEHGQDSKFFKLPTELFFHTDYRPFTSFVSSPDVRDEQTQVATHLMPPPFLVDIEGNPYSPEIQRLVPGREHCKTEQLVPVVAVYPGGRREVIEGLPNNRRSNIDVMIAQLAATRNVPGQGDNAPPGTVEASPNGNNNNGNAEQSSAQPSVNRERQSAATWQPGVFFGFRKKVVVPPLSPGVFRASEAQRLIDGDEEEDYYQIHLKKSPVSNSTQPHPLMSPTLSPSGRLSRNRRPPRRNLEPVYFQARDHREEHNILDEDEGIARPNPPQQEISYSQESPRRPVIARPNPSQNQIPNQNQHQNRPARPTRPSRRARYNVRRLIPPNARESDLENGLDQIPTSTDEESESMEEMSTSSSESEEESDSDWGGGGGRSRDNRENDATNKSKRTRRNRSSSPARSSSKPRGAKRAKRLKLESDSDGEESEPRPGPSSAMARGGEVKAEPGPKSRPKKKRVVAEPGGLEEVPEQFRPSEWLSEVMPKRSPYFPQLGDELVYFRQGHELYVKEVMEREIYQFDKKMKKTLPYAQFPNLKAEESVRVVGVKFEMVPPRLVNLRLAFTDWESGEVKSQYFYVKYHDLPAVADFLVLRQIYDKSVRHRWNEGDRFRCMMDKTWWLGTVEKKKPYEEKYSDSHFLSYHIRWDSTTDGNEHETLSPWDMEIITDDFEIPKDAKDGIPASEMDLTNGLYEVKPEDWQPHGHQDAECQRISQLVSDVMQLSISEMFAAPVDLNRYPDYAMTIEYLVDLNLIKERLDNLFYRRSASLITDIEHISSNAARYNQPESEIVKNAKVISDLLKEIVTNPNFGDVNETYHRIMERHNNSEPEPTPKKLKTRKPSAAASASSPDEGQGPVQAVDNSSEPGPSNAVERSPLTSRLRKRIKPSRRGERRQTDSDCSSRPWKDRCRELLQVIWNQPDSIHFRHAVNLLEYPDYSQVVDTPMCLQSIREDLGGGNYETPLQFDKDMKLIFQNSKNYNTDTRSQIRLMTMRLQSFYECRIKKILDDWKSKRSSRSHPSSSSSHNLRTPTKASARPVKTRSNYSISSPKPSLLSSPRRKVNLPHRRTLPMAARNGANSPRKCPQRLAAAKNPYIKNKSLRNRITPSPKKPSLSASSSGGSSSQKIQTRKRFDKVQANGSRGNVSAISRSQRTNSSMSGSAGGSTSTDHDRTEPLPSSSRPQRRKRLRISSGESTENTSETPPASSRTRIPAESRNGSGNGNVSSSGGSASVNGGSPKRSKVTVKEEPLDSDDEAAMVGGYKLRNKKSLRDESSSPDRNNGHNLRARNPKRKVLQDYDTDEYEEEEEEEKENNAGSEPLDTDNNEAVEGEDQEEDEEEEPAEEEEEDDDDEIQMPVLKTVGEDDEDYEVDATDQEIDDDGSDYEGEDVTPSKSNSKLNSNQLRRSTRSHKATKKLYDSEDEISDSSVRPRRKDATGTGKRRTRFNGKSATNYVEADGSESGDGEFE